MKEVAASDVSQALKGEARHFPAEQWWTFYGDEELNRLVEEGLAQSPSMTIAEARLNQAKAMAGIAESALFPDADANASLTMEKQSGESLMKSSAQRRWRDYAQATLDFRWEIDFWGKNRAALAAALSTADAAVAEQAEARLVLTASIATEYGEMARFYAIHDTLMAHIRVRKTSLRLFKRRFDEGLETLASVKQQEARLASSEQEIAEVEERIALQRNKIAALMGAGPDRGLAIRKPRLRASSGFALPATIHLALLGRRPDIVAARKRVESASSTIEERKAEFYPNVNLLAFIGVQSLGVNHLLTSKSDFGSIGPAISLPIFNGGYLRSRLFVAQATLEEAIGNYNQTVTHALQQVADAAVSQRSLGRQLRKINAATDAAKEAHRIVKKRYEGGLSNYLEVLTAEETFLTTLRTRSDLQSRSFLLDVALIRALGGGYRMPGNNTSQ
jgi:NodT family efflux transporter outer membrane factor (OMF) lipoprotein